ncbi:MAG TPA: SprT-like domain-containing protein [Gemmatimonadaceae bacterium]|nr:SprT-like domain-containing protein [Gemmatimonadaceae bacterium]
MTRKRAGRLQADPAQLPLGLEHAPQNAEQLLERLWALGLSARITRCRLTQNRAVMVSFSGAALRVHRGYLDAPPEVLHAIVRFVGARSRSDRRAAQRVILSYPVRAPRRTPVRRPRQVSPEDAALVRELAFWHREYNRRFFGARLRPIIIRISGRMRSRLGQYTAASPAGEPAEIAISRAHIRRHGWAEAQHTLLHEMVHQWQAEHGYDIDHGPTFRAKAVAIGIAPNARRELRPAARGRRVITQHELLRAARRA